MVDKIQAARKAHFFQNARFSGKMCNLEISTPNLKAPLAEGKRTDLLKGRRRHVGSNVQPPAGLHKRNLKAALEVERRRRAGGRKSRLSFHEDPGLKAPGVCQVSEHSLQDLDRTHRWALQKAAIPLRSPKRRECPSRCESRAWYTPSSHITTPSYSSSSHHF